MENISILLRSLDQTHFKDEFPRLIAKAYNRDRSLSLILIYKR
jgi:hypothetical protein